VQTLPDKLAGETAMDFGFKAEDMGEHLSDVLAAYGKTFMNIE